jgi:hypothetical protein
MESAMTANRTGKTIGRLAALGIPVGLFLSLAACVVDDGPTGLEITQDQFLDIGTESSDCIIPGAATASGRMEGVLDLAVPPLSRSRYYLYPLMENLLGPFSGLVPTGTVAPAEEKNNIDMKAFEVKLSVEGVDASFQWTAGCSGEFDAPARTVRIPPGGTASDRAEIIRPCNARPLYDYLSFHRDTISALTVNATIRAKGSLGSWDIVSPPFKLPIQVCLGCLQTGYTDPAAVPFSFPNIAKCSDLASNPYMGDPCNPGQDRRILCCATSFDSAGLATEIMCPAVPSGAPGP